MWIIFPLPFPPAPTAPTSDYFRQPFFQLRLRLRREGCPSVFLKPNLYIGAPPNRGILRDPPVPPPFTSMVNFFTPPSAFVGSAIGSRRNTLPLHTFPACSPSPTPPSAQYNAALLQPPPWLP